MKDTLGVSTSTKYVVDKAASVQINARKLVEFAQKVKNKKIPKPDSTFYSFDDPEKAANYCLAITSIDFCFYGEPKWKIMYDSKVFTGSQAMQVAVKRAIEKGVPLWDALYLANMKLKDMKILFQGEGELPLIETRLENLNEVGRVLIAEFNGKFSNVVQKANKSAIELVNLVTRNFSSFNDIATYKGRQVKFYKRAQLLCSQMNQLFNSKSLGQFDDFDQLTALADYKIPQFLRHFEVLEYSKELANKVDNLVQIPSGSEEEIEIRAATVWTVEFLRQELEKQFFAITAIDLDNLIWYMKSELPKDIKPHHRTRTKFY